MRCKDINEHGSEDRKCTEWHFHLLSAPSGLASLHNNYQEILIPFERDLLNSMDCFGVSGQEEECDTL